MTQDDAPHTGKEDSTVERRARDEIVNAAMIAARAADDKLASNTLLVDVGEVIGITDYFVITAGSNPRQVRAIANNIEEMVAREADVKALRREGNDTFEWVLIDFGSFICHVFVEEHRAYYELERLWRDRPRIAWAPQGHSEPSRHSEEE